MHLLCITPNVSIDRTAVVPGFAAGSVWRARAVAAACGGKGVNVARAAGALGHTAFNAGLVAGHTGRLAAELAAAEGLAADWTRVAGESRTCIIIVSDGGATTVVNEPGVAVAADDWQRLVADAARLSRGADAVCISGSMPRGVPAGGIAALIEAARGSGRPVWIDTSMPALAAAAAARPVGVKINADEARAWLGGGADGPGGLVPMAHAIAARCHGLVAITDGPGTAVLATAAGTWQATPPGIEVVSAIGSGDCFMAGLVLAFGSEADPGQALRYAVAAGAANAESAAAGIIDKAAVARLFDQTRVSTVRADR